MINFLKSIQILVEQIEAVLYVVILCVMRIQVALLSFVDQNCKLYIDNQFLRLSSFKSLRIKTPFTIHPLLIGLWGIISDFFFFRKNFVVKFDVDIKTEL